MPPAARSPYPAAAVAWLAGERPAQVLDLGSGRGGLARMLQAAGHQVFGVDRDVDQVTRLSGRLGGRQVVGQVESLPFLSCQFDVVTAGQNLHRFAPGLAVTEMARVLRPGGHLAVVYLTRDDTVPWVRRLTALLRAADPTAMSGEFGQASVQALTESPYFAGLEERSFRSWVPTTRDELVAMTARQPFFARLAPERGDALLAEVGALYDSSARPPEPLLLPFRATCWRAEVDHRGLALDDDADALRISLEKPRS